MNKSNKSGNLFIGNFPDLFENNETNKDTKINIQLSRDITQ